jgi:hypothetical protein
VPVSLIHLDSTLIDMFRGSTTMPAAMLGESPHGSLPISCGFFDSLDHSFRLLVQKTTVSTDVSL